MDPPDLSPNNQNKTQMVRHDVAEDERRQLFNELMDESSEGVLNKNGHRVNNLGQIASMTMPFDFEKGDQSGGTFANNSFREYHQVASPEVKFYFEYRGGRISGDSANQFHKTLAETAHDLTSIEIENLQGVLGAKRTNKDDFQLNLARTEDLNGKLVLVLEGRFLHHDLSVRTLFVDSDGTGSAVQEISFQSPTADFADKTAMCSKVFNSIKWKLAGCR